MKGAPRLGVTEASSLRARMIMAALAISVLAGSCGDSRADVASGSAATASAVPLKIGAIPDQDPEKLQRLHGTVAGYLEKALDVPVEYVPVTDYTAAVTLFKVGDLDLVWFGGLTGVQARLQVPGAQAIVQRDIDDAFRSVFIANSKAGVPAMEKVADLSALAAKRFTFGSESSTSGRLMPEYFLGQAGVKTKDFDGPPGFSGSHDKTIDLVAAGAYEAGVLSEQVWNLRVAEGGVDQKKVRVILRSPAYPDYHWVVRPGLEKRYGSDIVDRIRTAFEGLDRADPTGRKVLELFGAERFIRTDNSRYGRIEEVGRSAGLIR